jgi:tetratricopeptide (TPR) repeat protein
LPGENVYRFTHRLVRDAAYDAMPKSLRAKLHERYARWLDHEAAEAQRDDEAIGYHLEQAIRYLRELGPADDHVRELAALAAARLGAAGRRALASGDVAAATHLLERAAGLLADGEPEAAALLTDLAHALRATGDFQRATTVLETAIDAASAAGDRRRALLAEIERASLLDYAEPTKETFAELRAVAQRAIDAFTAAGDEHGLARAYCLLSEVHWAHCRFGAMEEELGRALVHSERAGEERERSWILESLARAAFLGPTPVEAAMARCRQIVEVGGADPKVKAVAVAMIGGLHGMNDEREEAREHFTESRRIGEEFNLREWRAAMPLYAGLVELLAGDGEAAEAEFRLGYSASDQIGDRSRRANHAAFLAEALYLQGRHEEAKDAAGEAAQESPPDDVFSQAVWHGVLGKISAHAGDAERAEHLGLEAVAIARETDCLALQGHALLDLVEALTMTGRSQDAAAAAEEALDCFREKGDVVSTRRAEQMRAAAGLTAAARKQYGPPVRRRGDADGSAA